MDGFHFISYSRRDAEEFALTLHDKLEAGPPHMPAWIDVRDIQPGQNWDQEIEKAIEACTSLVFLMTNDSVAKQSICNREWTQALQCRKPIVPVRVDLGVRTPMLLNSLHAFDFTRRFNEPAYNQALAQLRLHLGWLNSPRGQLTTLEGYLENTRRDHNRARWPEDRSRLQEEINELEAKIEALRGAVASSDGDRERIEAGDSPRESKVLAGSIRDRVGDMPPKIVSTDSPGRIVESLREDVVASGAKGEAQGLRDSEEDDARKRSDDRPGRGTQRESQPVGRTVLTKVLNTPPAIVPPYFQDRVVDTRLIGKFLKDESKRLMMVIGPPGIGKTATVCRVLKALEGGSLPDGIGPLSVDAIVYYNALGSRLVNARNLYEDLAKLLPDEMARREGPIVAVSKAAFQARFRGLAEAFPVGKKVPVLIDHFEVLLDPATQAVRDTELDDTLRALLTHPSHGIKVIVTSRVAPRELARIERGRQMRRDLDVGLESPYAENLLREMDAEGELGLRLASDDSLNFAREQTHGVPRALELLSTIRSIDRGSKLEEILACASGLLAENVTEALVGEAFGRLDLTDRRALQALAIYGRPVSSDAVDYLLRPHQPEVQLAALLERLVGLGLVREEAYAYYLDPVCSQCALSGLEPGEVSDRKVDEPPFTRYGLQHRAADYFRQRRLLPEDWRSIDDLGPQLAEFHLRCAGNDYEAAADVLLEVSFEYLIRWSWSRHLVELCGRLLHKLKDPHLESGILRTLGNAYLAQGRVRRAICYYKQALGIARAVGERQSECGDLTSLGLAYAELGGIERAIVLHGQALEIARATGDRRSEHASLGNLALAHADRGEPERAIELLSRSLEFERETGDRRAEGYTLCDLARASNDQECHQDAIQRASEGLEIAGELRDPILLNRGHSVLALGRLCIGDWTGARQDSERARQFDAPRNNHNVLVLSGVIALRQGDRDSAHVSFAAASSHARLMHELCAENHDALDADGLASAGLAVLEGGGHTNEAIAAFRAARGITRAPGIIRRVRCLLNILRPCDTSGVLDAIREVAESPGNGDVKHASL